MKRSVRGAAVPVVLIVVGVAAVCAVGGFVGGVIYANHNKGGLGDGASIGKETEPPAVAETAEPETIETEPTTEPLTEPFTNSLNAIEVTVSGNDYLYNNEAFTLDELAGILRINPELPVSVTDDNASLKAYNALIEKLKEQGIQFQIRN